jgi:hypothetical protein
MTISSDIGFLLRIVASAKRPQVHLAAGFLDNTPRPARQGGALHKTVAAPAENAYFAAEKPAGIGFDRAAIVMSQSELPIASGVAARTDQPAAGRA